MCETPESWSMEDVNQAKTKICSVTRPTESRSSARNARSLLHFTQLATVDSKQKLKKTLIPTDYISRNQNQSKFYRGILCFYKDLLKLQLHPTGACFVTDLSNACIPGSPQSSIKFTEIIAPLLMLLSFLLANCTTLIWVLNTNIL